MSTYIFDFDGTLADSMPFYASEMLSILERNRIDYPEDIIKIITPLGYKGAAKYYIENFQMNYTVDNLVELIHEELFPKYCNEIILKQGVTDYLKILKEQGHSLNVLSASPYRVLEVVLKRCGVIDLFDNVWSCEDFNRTKSEVEIYKEAIERVDGKLQDTFFFDDNLEALKTAARAGLYTIGVYDDSSVEYIEEIKHNVNKYIHCFEEMRTT